MDPCEEMSIVRFVVGCFSMGAGAFVGGVISQELLTGYLMRRRLMREVESAEIRHILAELRATQQTNAGQETQGTGR